MNGSRGPLTEPGPEGEYSWLRRVVKRVLRPAAGVLLGLISGLGMASSPPAPGQGFLEEAGPRGLSVPANNASFTGRGCALLDFDGDGDQDVVIAGGPGQPMYCFRNDGGGWFTDRTAASLLGNAGSSRGLAVADIDSDDDLDLYLCRSFGPNALWLNDGTGVFTEVGVAAGVDDPGTSFHAAFADFDRDGHVDLYVANHAGPQGVPLPNRLYRNQGDGTFVDVAVAAGVADAGLGFAATWLDVDEDGWPDLFVGNDRGGLAWLPGNALYRNLGNGSFQDASAAWQIDYQVDAMGAALGDAFNDGGWDLFVSNTAGFGHLFHRWNPTTSVYDEVATPLGVSAGGVGWSANFSDFDRDGWLDLHVVHSGSADALFMNPGAGGGPWSDAASTLGVALTDLDYVAAVGDLDDDGRPDLVLPGFLTATRLLRNATPGGGYLTLDLRGRAARRDAIGAVATVATGGLTQRRVVTSTPGFQGSSDLRLHFGLGTATSASVSVRWPSGQRQDLGVVAANQILIVREPELGVVTSLAGWPLSLEAWLTQDAGRPYALLLTLGTNPGFPLSDGRVIPANPDALAWLSLTPGNPVLASGFGQVPPAGPVLAPLQIPALAGLSGFRFFATGLTADPAFPDGVRTILRPLAVTLP